VGSGRDDRGSSSGRNRFGTQELTLDEILVSGGRGPRAGHDRLGRAARRVGGPAVQHRAGRRPDRHRLAAAPHGRRSCSTARRGRPA
jgi:hypothetical protein